MNSFRGRPVKKEDKDVLPVIIGVLLVVLLVLIVRMVGGSNVW